MLFSLRNFSSQTCMKYSLFSIALLSSLMLAACMDTTGLSAESSRKPKGNFAVSSTIIEYSDLQCPACKTAHEAVVKPLLQKYGGGIRFEFRHFPLLTTHLYALDAAQAAECAADQGRFWEFIDIAYARQEALNRKVLPEWAAEAGVRDADLFGRCFASDIKRKTVLNDLAAGKVQGVRWTPTFFVNGTVTESTLDALSTAINELANRDIRP